MHNLWCQGEKFMSFHSIDPSSVSKDDERDKKMLGRGGVAIMSWARKRLSVVHRVSHRRWRARDKSPLHVASRTIAYDFDWLCIVKKLFYSPLDENRTELPREDLFHSLWADLLKNDEEMNLIIRWWNSSPESLDIIIWDEETAAGREKISINLLRWQDYK